MNYLMFNTLVSTLDPMRDQCAVRVNRASLLNMENAVPSAVARNDHFFDGRQEVSLTREYVFGACAGVDLERGLHSALYWGYPRNLHGVCSHVHQNYEIIINLLRNYRNVNLSLDDYHTLSDSVFIPARGVNISTFSKILYFCNVRFNGNPCVIYDNRVKSKINCLSDEVVFDGLRHATHMADSYTAYWHYVESVAALAPIEDGIIRSDKVEYVLWL